MSWNPFDWWERRKLAKKLVIAIERRHDELGLSDSERALRWAAFTDNVELLKYELAQMIAAKKSGAVKS